MPLDDIPSFPLADLLGLHIFVPDNGRAIARVTVSETHLNPNGAVHGMVLFAMVDTAMGAAALSVLGAEQRCASTDVHVRFLRPVTSGSVLEAGVHVRHHGRSMITLDGEVRDPEGKLVATATGNFSVLKPR